MSHFCGSPFPAENFHLINERVMIFVQWQGWEGYGSARTHLVWGISSVYEFHHKREEEEETGFARKDTKIAVMFSIMYLEQWWEVVCDGLKSEQFIRAMIVWACGGRLCGGGMKTGENVSTWRWNIRQGTRRCRSERILMMMMRTMTSECVDYAEVEYKGNSRLRLGEPKLSTIFYSTYCE